jgi:hypothetical protein
MHKPTDCLMGKRHKEYQKKRPQMAVANSAAFAAAAAAATTAANPQFAALMASIANLDK